MGQEAIGWTGPGRSWKGAGWSVFYKEPTALLNAEKEILFFQAWGNSGDSRSWEPVWEPELGLIRPPCPDLVCGSSNSADLGESWFECLSCGKIFPDASFYARATSLVSPGKLKLLQALSYILKDRQEFEDLAEEKRKLHEAEGRRKLRLIREERKRAKNEELSRLVERAKNPPPEYIPMKPAPTQKPIYASLLAFCERQAQRRAVKAYCEWLMRNPSVKGQISRPERQKISPWAAESTGQCPASREVVSKMISDVKVLCPTCGHSFWHSFPFGIVKGNPKCSCCREEK